jgi:uncharacterized membrane protein YhhN
MNIPVKTLKSGITKILKNDRNFALGFGIFLLAPSAYSLVRYGYLHYGSTVGNWASIPEIILGVALILLAIFEPKLRTPKDK